MLHAMAATFGVAIALLIIWAILTIIGVMFERHERKELEAMRKPKPEPKSEPVAQPQPVKVETEFNWRFLIGFSVTTIVFLLVISGAFF